MRRKIYCTSDGSLRKELDRWIADRKVPENGSIIKQRNDYGETYYWKITYDPEDVNYSDSVEEFVINEVFALELPQDDFGGMAWGDISDLNGDWEYSSYEDAEADGFGHSEDF